MPIVEDDFHGFLYRNCECMEQLRLLISCERNT